ncbi:MAG: hypothetical protein WBZ36_01455 [Candidatus Nitrosopolaris sp.]
MTGSFHFSRKTIFIMTLLTASTVLIPFLNQNQIAIAQQRQEKQEVQNSQISSSLTKQRQQPTGISFQIDNTTFSHHMAVVNNGVQLHYVIGGHGFIAWMASNMVFMTPCNASSGQELYCYCT